MWVLPFLLAEDSDISNELVNGTESATFLKDTLQCVFHDPTPRMNPLVTAGENLFGLRSLNNPCRCRRSEFAMIILVNATDSLPIREGL